MKKVLSIFTIVLVMHCITLAQSKEETQVAEAVEKLRLAMIDPTKTVLDDLVSDVLSYGHSSGKIDTKTSFIEDLLTSKSDFVSMNLNEQTIKISDNVAMVRHKLIGESMSNGKTAPINLYVLLVYQKQKGGWKLIARQAAKIV